MSTSRESSGSQPLTHNVVSLTKYIPYEGIPHAGGEYLQSHLKRLREIANVALLAPETPLNDDAMAHQNEESSASFIQNGLPRLKGMAFRIMQIEATLAGCRMYWPIRNVFRGNKAPWGLLKQADLIELQWSEMISLAPAIRKKLPHATLVGVAHDINTQRWERLEAASRSWPRRALARYIARQCRKHESRSFDALDCLIVFSDKDAELAEQLAPKTRVEVVHPGFATKPMVREPNPEEPIALFVGAMNRPENWEAAIWFLDHVWPAVLKQVPTARFVAAGAHPPRQLLNTIRRAPRAEATGFVESLEHWYAIATICVVPLQRGAGVKFKTIDALLAGVPVVTTAVGAEGIDAENFFAAKTDDPDVFANATVTALKKPDAYQAFAAKQWAESIYGEEAFTKRISDVYGSLLND